MWQLFFCLLALTAAVPDDDDHFESAEIYVKAVPGVTHSFNAAVPVVETFPTASQYNAPVNTGAFDTGATGYGAAVDTGATGYGTAGNTGATGYGAQQPTFKAAETPTNVDVTHVEAAGTGVQPSYPQNAVKPYFIKVDDDDDFKVAFTPGQFRTVGGNTPFFYKKFSAEVDDDDYYRYAPSFRTVGGKTPVIYKRSVEVDDDFIAVPSTQFRSAGGNTPVLYRKFSAEVDDDYNRFFFRTAANPVVPVPYSAGGYRVKYDDDDDDRKFFFRTAGTAAVPLTYSAGYRFKYDDDDDRYDFD